MHQHGYDGRSLGNAILFPGHKSPSWRSGRWLDCSPTGPFATDGYLDTNNWVRADGKSVYISFLMELNYTNVPFYYEFEFKRGDKTQTIGSDLNAQNSRHRQSCWGLHCPTSLTGSLWPGFR